MWVWQVATLAAEFWFTRFCRWNQAMAWQCLPGDNKITVSNPNTRTETSSITSLSSRIISLDLLYLVRRGRVDPLPPIPMEWNSGASGKSCYGETVPTSGGSYPGAYPDQMRVIETVLKGMNSPTYLLDITMLSAMRKDAHPSIYSGDLSPGQKANPDHSADCSHWCLPGLPDTWNQLFYTALFF